MHKSKCSVSYNVIIVGNIATSCVYVSGNRRGKLPSQKTNRACVCETIVKGVQVEEPKVLTLKAELL